VPEGERKIDFAIDESGDVSTTIGVITEPAEGEIVQRPWLSGGVGYDDVATADDGSSCGTPAGGTLVWLGDSSGTRDVDEVLVMA